MDDDRDLVVCFRLSRRAWIRQSGSRPWSWSGSVFSRTARPRRRGNGNVRLMSGRVPVLVVAATTPTSPSGRLGRLA